jgi:hypothetical protein
LLLTDAFFLSSSHMLTGQIDPRDLKEVWFGERSQIDLGAALQQASETDLMFGIDRVEHMMAEFHKYPFISILLSLGIFCTSIFHLSKNFESTPVSYQITYEISDGLKAYANFTGKQFLIINHDSYDWKNVTVAVKAMKGGSPVVVESIDSDEIAFAFAVPRIKAGEMYTLQTRQLTAQTSLGVQALPTQTYSLRILGMTPWGPSSSDGRWEQIASRVP